MSDERERLQRLRVAVENANPAAAAAALTRRLERDAIVLPAELRTPPSGPAGQAHRDAGELYRSLVIAGQPQTIAELMYSSLVGHARILPALGYLRETGLVAESPRAETEHGEIEWRLRS